MVLSIEVIKNSPEFHVAWLLGSDDEKSLGRREILSQDLPSLCLKIREIMPESGKSTLKKTGLYQLAILMNGAVKAHRIQVSFLEKDVKKLKELMKKRSFVMIFAEQFDREVEAVKSNVDSKFRSLPILCVEDIDKWVDLADLPMISEQIGINGDPREITMMDVAPNDWQEVHAELTGMYGSIAQFSQTRGDYTMYSTFVEGNGSDENRERRLDAVVVDMEDMVLPPRPLKRKSPNEVDVAQDPILDALSIKDPVLEDFTRIQNPTEQSNLMDDQPDKTLFAQCSLLDLEVTDLTADTPRLPPFPPQAPPMDDLDIPQVAPQSEALYQNYLEQTARTTELLPMPDEIEFITGQPGPKRMRMEEKPDEEDAQERARRRASSRPVTPLNRTDLTTRTDIDTTRQEDEISFQLDSQIVIPERQRSKRKLKLPPIYGDDLEIDVNIQKALQADCSSLVRPIADVKYKSVTLADKVWTDYNLPASAYPYGNRVSAEIKNLLKPIAHRYRPKDDDSDDEEEEEENATKNATTTQLVADSFQSNPLYANLDVEYQMLNDPVRPPLEEQPNIEETLIEKARYGQASLLEEPAPQRDEFGVLRLDSPLPPSEKFMMTRLDNSPQRTRTENEIIEQLQLQPLPVDDLEFSNRTEPLFADKENVRRRPKSSLGIQSKRVEELDEDTDQREIREMEEERKENRKLAMGASFEDDGLYFFTSGSLLPDNRRRIQEALLTAVQNKHPDYLDFHEHTSTYIRKEAATAFTELLSALKNMKVTAVQDEPYGPILVSHVPQEN